MSYIIKPEAMTSSFLVPSAAVDGAIKLASHTQLKVLLCFLRNLSNGADAKSVADFLKIPLSEAEDALRFWVQAGILSSIAEVATPTETPKAPAKKTVAKAQVEKPNREEIFSSAASDAALAWLLQEAEMTFGRALRFSEMQTLAWLYLDHGMDVSLLITLITYAIKEGKATTSFIESTALIWLEQGISTLSEADAYMTERNMRKTAWGMIEKAFGLDHRMPSEKELVFASEWVIKWGFGEKMLKAAYNICVDKNAKISMPYINKILKSWFEKGIKSPEDIAEAEASKAKTPKKSADGFGAYDKSLVEKLLHSDDDDEEE
jgi:DnaD/phage-associated family protein